MYDLQKHPERVGLAAVADIQERFHGGRHHDAIRIEFPIPKSDIGRLQRHAELIVFFFPIGAAGSTRGPCRDAPTAFPVLCRHVRPSTIHCKPCLSRVQANGGFGAATENAGIIVGKAARDPLRTGQTP
jgi:hypothetical protein